MTRWLWIWFLVFLAFPVAISGPAGDKVRAKVSPVAAAVEPGGPLLPVLDSLEWVEGHRARAADFAGHVVIVEYWTFACVNCRRTLPAMHALAKRYHDTDVRILSIHSPELEIERDPAKVAEAVAKEQIPYPVALDPDFKAWRAVDNEFWPCLYILDSRGKIQYRHDGELHENTPAWNGFVKVVEKLRRSPRTG